MSKKLRNRGPSEEKIQKAIIAYRITKYLLDDQIDSLITNIVKKHPDTFIQTVKEFELKDISWEGLICWMDENFKKHSSFIPSNLRPSKIQFIKLHRMITRSGLKEAKEEVEAFMSQKNWTSNRWD